MDGSEGAHAPNACLIAFAWVVTALWRNLTAAIRWLVAAARTALIIIGEVLGQLGHVASLGQLLTRKLSSSTGAHIHAVDVLGSGEVGRRKRSALLGLDAC